MNSGKSVLFVCPKVAGFYKEIISELESREYIVDYIFDKCSTNDPDFIHAKNYNCGGNAKEVVLKEYEQYWKQLLCSNDYDKKYDILLVVDGKMLHPCLFSILRKRNPQVRFINYLFDTSRGNYNFHKNAKYFNSVYSYDKHDCAKYNYVFLPIPWVQQNNIDEVHGTLDLFGMGTYDPERYKIYTFVKDIAKQNGYSYFLKLYMDAIEYYPIKFVIGTVLKIKKYLSPRIYYSKMIVHKKMPSEIFIKKMNCSRVIVDSINPYQDGLTARCTWALGAEKKIITNNTSIKEYDFFDPDQIFVIENYSEKTMMDLKNFIETDFLMKEANRKMISQFRLDNWVDILLS